MALCFLQKNIKEDNFNLPHSTVFNVLLIMSLELSCSFLQVGSYSSLKNMPIEILPLYARDPVPYSNKNVTCLVRESREKGIDRVNAIGEDIVE